MEALELRPHDTFRDDPLSRFGVLEAQKHRERGIPLSMFLGLFKYYRQTYQDLITEKHPVTKDHDEALRKINRVFDRFEMAFILEWSQISGGDRIADLETSNRKITNEKNRFLTVIESLASPVLLFTPEGRLSYANREANRLWGHVQIQNEGIYYQEQPDLALPEPILDMVREFLDNPNLEIHTRSVTLDFHGNRYHYQLQIMPMRDVSDKFRGLVLIAHDITLLEQAKDALQESEERYRNIFDNHHTPMLSINPKTQRIVNANPAALEFYGYTADEIKNLSHGDINTASADILSEEIKQAIEQDKKHFRFCHRLKDGTLREVEIFSGPIAFQGQTLLYSIIHDVTDRIQAEAALQESEERYRLLAENITDIIWTMDIDGRFTYVSPSVERLRGYTPEEALRQGIAEALTPESADLVRQTMVSFRKAVAQGHIPQGHLRFELEQPTKEGSTVWTEVDATPVFDAEGASPFFIGVSRDITLRKETQEKLNQLASVVDQAMVSILITRLDGEVIYLNPHAELTSGYTKDELLGQTPRLFKSGMQDQAFYTDLWATIGQGKTWTGTLINRRKNGELYHEYAVVFPLKNSQGQPLAYAAVKRDITEQVRAEEALKTAKELAEIGSQAKGMFLANMSHEIRTPMNAIMGFAEILENRIDDPSLLEFARNIRSAGASLLTLINGILDFSRIELGGIQLKAKPFDVILLLDELQQMFSWRLTQSDVILRTRVTPPFPNQFVLDGDRLRQILLNLVGNAVKFTEQGHIDIDLSVQAETDNQADLVISVSDTGIGISPDQQKRIFEAFIQAEGQDHAKYGGTGLGLAITRRLVELMGGQITVASQPGQGAQFTVILPQVEIAHSQIGHTSTGETDHPTGKTQTLPDTSWKLSRAQQNRLPELLEKLETQCQPAWNRLNKSMIIHEVIEFSERMDHLGALYQLTPLSQWGQRLNQLAHDFDMAQLPETLKEFPGFIDRIKASTARSRKDSNS